jgi:flavin reductase (DIM6/NTAB) family NADH-FMN oxidoreductase RutF
LLLICYRQGLTCIEAFRAASYFGINVLSEDQREISDRFARKGHDRFNGTPWVRGETGVPLLPNALAHIECAVHERFISGDHDIFVGRMVRADTADGDPLLYFASRYREIRELP